MAAPEHARQTELADDRAVRALGAQQRGEHIHRRDGDSADEDARGRADDERDREQREDRDGAH